MALTPGATLGPYQVTAKIGEGGMRGVSRPRHQARPGRGLEGPARGAKALVLELIEGPPLAVPTP